MKTRESSGLRSVPAAGALLLTALLSPLLLGFIHGGPHALTVVGGYGSGFYDTGAVVHVFADVDPYTSDVTGWQSSVPGASLPDEWHFVFTMPDSDVTLTPEITPVSMNLSETVLAGVNNPKRVIYAVPPDPLGVVFTFHGTGGSADVIHKPSMQYVARLAYHRGYAVVSTDAEERTLGDPGPDGKIRWDTSLGLATNVDLQNIQLLSSQLSQLTAIPTDAPRFAVGISNGGSFAITVGAVLPFTAVSAFCGVGRTLAWSLTLTPTQWLMCGNDTNPTVSGQRAQWMDGNLNLASRSIPTDYDELQASPVFEGRLARINGVDFGLSAAGVAELAANGRLDSSGFLLTLPDDLSVEVAADPASWPSLNALTDASSPGLVLGELKHAWADHQMHDDWAARTLDFLEAQIPSPPALPSLGAAGRAMLWSLLGLVGCRRLQA
ncbi:MAG: hypothetical protein ACE5FL_13745 [Myxococcota bacterium]